MRTDLYGTAIRMQFRAGVVRTAGGAGLEEEAAEGSPGSSAVATAPEPGQRSEEGGLGSGKPSGSTAARMRQAGGGGNKRAGSDW